MPDFATIRGRIHHFTLREGSSKIPVVFVNSLGTDLRIWEEVIARLPSDLTILAYDKAGHGLSEGGVDSIAEFAADLAALMDAKMLKGVLVCGVSVGGMIAQALAAHRPDLVAGLVLCNTAHRIGTPEAWRDRIAALDTTGLEPMANGIMERWFSPAFRRSSTEVVAGYHTMLTRTPIAGYRAVCAAIRDADLTNATSKITCPTLCVAGGDDQATPPTIVEEMSSLITGARYISYDGVGHLPCIEVPGRLALDIRAQLCVLA